MNSNINEILENEKAFNEKEPWLKLNKTLKIDKIKEYVETYSLKHNFDDIQKNDLLSFLCNCLDKKKLLKSKEVDYDKENGIINHIPNLILNNKKFTLKRCEKRQSTLKSLAPKKTIKNTQKEKKTKIEELN
tara:strand:- start:119 stop:514 length:396 start_codon:yes stop_codon:yes gene_type:complete